MTTTANLSELISAYVPMDRRHALAGGYDLPEHTHGAALFADIAGFTALTEALALALGPRRGAEELLCELNHLYDALVAQVHRYHGSVLGFSGDAITCWFDERYSVHRAVTCALAMQQAMQTFGAVAIPGREAVVLGLKVAIAAGPARRFVAGDPAVQLHDVLAGATVERMAAGEHLAGPGETLVDEAVVAALGAHACIGEWRADPQTGARFAVLLESHAEAVDSPWLPIAPGALSAEQLRPWLPPAVYARLQAGQGEFLAELRPTAALFLRFSGIDYDGDEEAGVQFDAFLRGVQAVLVRHDGTLVQLIIGDKGSYLYAAFGATVAHEDDARRAIVAALELRQAGAEIARLAPVQIGVSRGVMHVGAYGSHDARCYSCIGDDVNLAARLMMQAAPGEVLVSGRLHKDLADAFTFEPRAPLALKGKTEPLPVFAVTGAAARRAIRLQEPSYSLPMIGRTAELEFAAGKLELALQGRGQVLGICGEAGTGKSRLVAELIRLARQRGFSGYGGACQSSGTNTSYLVWKPIWQAFFDIDPAAPVRRQIRNLQGQIEDLVPERIAATPLLAGMLDLPLPDNNFTRTLDAQFRRSAMEALLVGCLKAAAGDAPVLLVLEDLHWIDPVSHDLLERVAYAIRKLPVLVALTYRPPEIARLQALRVEALEHFSRIDLKEIDAADAEQIIRAKLAQLFPEWREAVPAALIARVSAHAQGNPFYIEELLNYLHDRRIDLQDAAAIEDLELPDSLHRLILARIDQLSLSQQLTLKVASVLGRLFRFVHLHGYYPALGDPLAVKADLGELARLDITPLAAPEPDLAYLFRHVVAHEVTYETLPQATRAALHEQYARYLEANAGDLDRLAYHYAHSENLAKQREYLRRAGEAALARFAHVEAADYLSRALALAPEEDLAERYALLLAREQAYDFQGRREEQGADLDALEPLATALGESALQAEVALRRSEYHLRKSEFHEVICVAQAAAEFAEATGSFELQARAYHWWGEGLGIVGNVAEARSWFERERWLAQAAGAKRLEASALRSLGNSMTAISEFSAALGCYQQALGLYREAGDRQGECEALTQIGNWQTNMGELADAQPSLEQSLQLSLEIGFRFGQCFALINLSLLLNCRYVVARARACLDDVLALAREIGARHSEGSAFYLYGDNSFLVGRFDWARSEYERSREILHALGSVRELHALSKLAQALWAQGDYQEMLACAEQALDMSRQLSAAYAEASALECMGDALAGLGRAGEARAAYEECLSLGHKTAQEEHWLSPPGAIDLCLAHGDVSKALALAGQIISVLGEDILLEASRGGQERLPVLCTPYPARYFMAIHRALAAAGDARAAPVLCTGHTLLQGWAAQIDDDELRRAFLEDVPWNRELAALGEQARQAVA
jgi:adenylate cyclase